MVQCNNTIKEMWHLGLRVLTPSGSCGCRLYHRITGVTRSLASRLSSPTIRASPSLSKPLHLRCVVLLVLDDEFLTPLIQLLFWVSPILVCGHILEQKPCHSPGRAGFQLWKSRMFWEQEGEEGCDKGTAKLLTLLQTHAHAAWWQQWGLTHCRDCSPSVGKGLTGGNHIDSWRNGLKKSHRMQFDQDKNKVGA